MTIATKAFQDVNSYISGFDIQKLNDSKLTVGVGQARDSQNRYDIALTSPVTVDTSLVGVAGGLDQGAIAATTVYYIYVMANSLGNLKPTATLSTSTTTPLLFGGYDCFRLVGVWATGVTPVFLNGFSAGKGNDRKFFYNDLQIVLNAGAATTLTDVALTSFVPKFENVPVVLHVQHTSPTVGAKANVTGGGSGATTSVGASTQVANVAATADVEVLTKLISGAPTIRYINSNASSTTSLWVHSFEYYV